MSEFGFYGQIGTIGIGFGYDTENGFTGSVFASVSAVVTVDSWTSVSTGGGFEGSTGYVGVGTPTGTTIAGLNGSVQVNQTNGLSSR